MKLEAGKKYVLQNGAVVECLAVWFREYYGFQASVVMSGEKCPSRYTLDGHFHRNKGESDYNIVAEYKEPVRVAEYLVQQKGNHWVFTTDGQVHTAEKPYHKETHVVGQQPEGSILIPNSEREESK